MSVASSQLEVVIRILLVEDHDGIADRVSSGLTEAGFIVDRADNGSDGFAMGCDEAYDAVILDLGLPGLEGLDVLKKWRAENRTYPVLILTARGTWSEKVDGLNAGADDYLSKPFELPEVVARLNALIRRSSGLSSPLLSHRNVTLDTATDQVTVDGEPIDLTARELKMLKYFLHRSGRTIPQAELTEHLYALEDSRESNTIEVYVSRLRRKFGSDFIKTVRGLGYRLN